MRLVELDLELMCIQDVFADIWLFVTLESGSLERTIFRYYFGIDLRGEMVAARSVEEVEAKEIFR